MASAVTRVAIVAHTEDQLETVRRAVAFADAMVAEGARIFVTGDLSIDVRFEAPEPIDEPDVPSGGPD